MGISRSAIFTPNGPCAVVGVGRKNWLFCGSEAGGENLAIILSLVTTCKNLGIDVRCYLEDVLSRVNAHPHQRLDELLPDRWKSIQEAAGRDVSAPKRQGMAEAVRIRGLNCPNLCVHGTVTLNCSRRNCPKRFKEDSWSFCAEQPSTGHSTQ